jgi:hypothetical protein
MCDRGYTVIFKNNCAIIKKSNFILIADRKDDLYYLRSSDVNVNNSANFSSESIDSSKRKFADVQKWHCRMGHLNLKDLIESDSKGNIRGLNISKLSDDFNCEVCALNKLTRAPFPKRSDRNTNLLEIVHSDLCGPIRIPSIGKSLYFITFIDDYSRYCAVKFLKTKSEALDAFKEIKNLWENQKSTKIKIFMSDNGGEFINTEFENFLKESGIQHRLTTPHCPEQGGIAERKNRTLVEMARCLLSQSKLSLNLWAEAVNTANYVRNRCPTKSLNGKTPYELWNNVVPNVCYFKIFGCTAYYLNNKPKHKFSARSKKGIFVGYSENSKAFRIYIPDENRVIISRSVKFFEENTSEYSKVGQLFDDSLHREIKLSSTKSESQVKGENSFSPPIEMENENSNKFSLDSAPERLEEQNTLSLRNRDVIRKMPTVENVYSYNSEIAINNALKSAEAPEWYNAMMNEVKTILKNDTFVVVDRPRSQKCVGSRFVLTNKYSQNGSILKNKARLVARGFSQKPGIDFRETFAPVARMGSIRVMAGLAAKLGINIHQFDITSAYLNGKLDEEIFMECPDYFKQILELITKENSDSDISRKAIKTLKSINEGDKVLLLKKSLYGLKQAGRCWNTKLNELLNNFGAKQTSADPCLYYIKNEKGLTLIMVYVDDILFMSQDPDKLENFKIHLNKELEVKYSGVVKYCLGINFQIEKGIVAMSQQSYIRELLERFSMSEAKPVTSPMDMSIRLQKAEKCDENEYPYRELVGSLMYLATSTRPDIANAVSQLSQFLNCFDKTHWTAAKRVLRYLKKTINFGLIFRQNDEPLYGYTDADWGNCPNDRKSYTGYCFIFCGSSITWESRKQCTVALSSTEAEYMALSDATKEGIYLRKLLNELCDENIEKVSILTDNTGSIKLAENPIFHKRTKHIDIRHHFIRDALKNGIINVNFVSTEDMGADILTKALPSAKHYKCCKIIGLEDTSLIFG